MSARRWTHQTAEKIARCLAESLQLKISATAVRRLLKKLGYSLKSNRKCLSAGNSPYRDAQFSVIKRLRQQFAQSGDPVICVDSKKKELIGLFKNPGKIWCRDAPQVQDHDFRSQAVGLACPYGIYDVGRNFGVLVVGQSADTPAFAVNSILTWWRQHGQDHYRRSQRLLVLADCGGSNGAAPRAWKKLLQERLADPYGLTITVAHYPPGASKWNPIEHRLFSEITKNWAGEPLKSFQTVVDFARKTRTLTGLRVEAYRDRRVYQKGIKVSDQQLEQLSFARSNFLGKWNYTFSPRPQSRAQPHSEAILTTVQANPPTPETQQAA
jgi:hypothetical protein